MIDSHELINKYNTLVRRYKSLFEESRDIIYISKADGKITSINPHGLKLLGYSSNSEVLGKSITDFYYSPSDRDHYLNLILKNGFIKDFEIILLKKSGEKLVGLESAQSIKDPDGTIIEYTGIVKDITERVNNEMFSIKKNIELTATNKKLEEAQMKVMSHDKLASVGFLAAGIAHEINNPLGYLKSGFESMRIYFDKILEYARAIEQAFSKTEEYRQLGAENPIAVEKKRLKIDKIIGDLGNLNAETKDGFDKIISIINSLKNFSHVDSAQKITLYNLNSGIEDTLRILHNEIKYVATVEKNLSELPPIECFGGEINQVLLNVILNAAQAIKAQKRKTTGKITVSTSYRDGFVYCSIGDDGPGIPADIRDKIFDPFFTTKGPGVSTGLGLNIAYDIVTKHKGSLTVKDTKGSGATFELKLPTEMRIKEI